MKGISKFIMIFVFILPGLLQACSPTNQQILTEGEISEPTALPAQIINQDTALDLAFSKFKNSTSFSEDIQWQKVPLDGKEPSSGTYQVFLNLENQIKLTGQDSLVYQGYLFSKDSTGILKPVQKMVWSEDIFFPKLTADFGIPNLEEAQYIYSGEKSEGAIRFFSYDLVFPQIPYEVNNYFGTYIYTDLNCTVFINAETGYLEKIEESYTFTYTSNYSAELNETGNLTQTTRLTQWDDTDFVLPEIIKPDNKELVDYSGTASDLISFKYPKAASLMDSAQSIQIFLPDSDNYVFFTQNATLAIFSLETETPSSSYENNCQTYFEAFYIPSMIDTQPDISLTSTEWIMEGELGFCKGVVQISPDKTEVIYFVNQPNRIAGAQKRLLPVTLYISVTMENSNEPDTAYWDWISTLEFVE